MLCKETQSRKERSHSVSPGVNEPHGRDILISYLSQLQHKHSGIVLASSLLEGEGDWLELTFHKQQIEVQRRCHILLEKC